jgi:hypothetical protein
MSLKYFIREGLSANIISVQKFNNIKLIQYQISFFCYENIPHINISHESQGYLKWRQDSFLKRGVEK